MESKLKTVDYGLIMMLMYLMFNDEVQRNLQKN